MTSDEFDQAMLDLRARGLTYASLAVVADYVYGWKLTSGSIRWRLRHRLGVAPDPTRARFGHANGMARR